MEGPAFPSRPPGGHVRLSRIARVFAWTGLTSIGGGRYAFFYDALVVRRRWVANKEFVQDLTLSQVLPGPTFSNIAVALGFRLGGWRGALWGGVALILPGALILLALAALYFRGALSPALGGAMHGMSAAVVGLVFATTARVIVGRDPRLALAAARRGGVPPGRPAPREHGAGHRARDPGRPLALSPAAAVLVIADLARLGWTFLWLSMICVGGGLGVVPEMQRQVVDRFHWVTAREFLDGYALSQLTPGPNMLVVVFVGYGAHGVIGGLVALAAMFLPASVLAALIARHWASLRQRPWATAVERALLPVGIGLMTAGVYTLARSGIRDVPGAAIAVAAVLVLWTGRVPAMLVVLAAGAVGWLAAR